MTWRAAMRLVAAMIVFLVIAQPSALAQTKLTLEQAVATALEHNPLHKAALYDQRAASAGVKQARAAFLPHVGFSELYQDGNDPVFIFGAKLRQQRFSTGDFALNSLNTPTPFSNFGTRLSGGWQLFDSGVSWFRLKQAQEGKQLAQRHLQRTDQELVMHVVDAYVSLLLAMKQLETAENTLHTAESILDRSRANVSAGMAVESDLLSALVNEAAQRQELIRAKNAAALARAKLNHELGVASETSYEPAELLAERVFPTLPVEELEKRALENRPDLQAVQLQEKIQSHGLSATKAALGPRLSVIGNWEMDNPWFTGGGGNNWMTGLELQIDLFTGGAKLARLEQQTALKQKAEALRESAANAVRLEVRKAYLDFDTARQQVDVARAAVDQAQESLRIGQNRYESGLNTITDLLRMQEAGVRAQTDYWQAVYRLHTSYANLELATGTLDASSPVIKP